MTSAFAENDAKARGYEVPRPLACVFQPVNVYPVRARPAVLVSSERDPPVTVNCVGFGAAPLVFPLPS